MVTSIDSMLPKQQFNTSVAKMMEFVNYIESVDRSEVGIEEIKGFLVILSIFAPFIAQELWESIGQVGFVSNEAFPLVDSSILNSGQVEIPVVINGKVRFKVMVEIDDEEHVAKSKVEAFGEYMKYVPSGVYKKFIYVPGKIINIVA